MCWGRFTAFKLQETTLRLRRANRIRTVQGSLAIEANTLSDADIKAFLECHAGYYLYAVCSSGGWWAVPTLRRITSRNGYVQTPQLCQNIRRNAQKPLIVALLLPIHKYPNHTPHLKITPAILNQVAEIALSLYLLRFLEGSFEVEF